MGDGLGGVQAVVPAEDVGGLEQVQVGGVVFGHC